MKKVTFLPNPLKVTTVTSYDKALELSKQWIKWKNARNIRYWHKIVLPETDQYIPTGPKGEQIKRQLPGPFYVVPPALSDRLKRVKALVANTLRNSKALPGSGDDDNLYNRALIASAKILEKNPRFRSPAYDALFSSDLDRKTRIYQEKLKKHLTK